MGTVLLLAQYERVVNAFTCEPQHPQVAVCRAKFVIRGKILTISKKTEYFHGIPKPKHAEIEVMDIFKDEIGITQNTIKVDIHNPWPRKFIIGDEYLLTGYGRSVEQMMISMCNWCQTWDTLTRVRISGIEGKNSFKNCKCEIFFCPIGEDCRYEHPGCIWNAPDYEIGIEKSDCDSKNGICAQANDGSCSWQPENMSCTNSVEAWIP